VKKKFHSKIVTPNILHESRTGVSKMSEKKAKLVNLVTEHNVSAIVTLSEKLGIKPEDVIELIKELIFDGKLQGTITEDEKRFFRSDAKVSDAPVIEREDIMPEFLSYNTRPGYIVAIIGAIVLVSGGIVSVNAADAVEQNFAAGLFLFGLAVLFVGLFYVARRKTPD